MVIVTLKFVAPILTLIVPMTKNVNYEFYFVRGTSNVNEGYFHGHILLCNVFGYTSS